MSTNACRFGANCVRKNACRFYHSESDRASWATTGTQQQTTIDCLYGSKCANISCMSSHPNSWCDTFTNGYCAMPGCESRHPKKCKNASECYTFECVFSHPNERCTCKNQMSCFGRHSRITDSLNWEKLVSHIEKGFKKTSAKSTPKSVADSVRIKLDDAIKRFKIEMNAPTTTKNNKRDEMQSQFDGFWNSIVRAFRALVIEDQIKYVEFKWLVKRELFRLESNRLPALAFREQFEEYVMNDGSQAVIVRGQTGSGKSTQLTQYLAELSLMAGGRKKVICTQPRKLAAVSLAERVAFEYGAGEAATPVTGGNNDRKFSPLGKYVGYRVGGRFVCRKSTLIEYYTEEKFINSLMSGTLNYDTVFAVVIDEAHERNINTDIIMGILKRDIFQHPHLKVVVTSATIDPKIFSNYFFDCPTLDIPGRTFPVEIVYSPPAATSTFGDDSINICALAVAHSLNIHKSLNNHGDILCFLTGLSYFLILIFF